MYTWTLTPAMEAEIARIEELRRRLDRATLPRRWEGRLRRELEAASTAASTSMEGVPVTVDEVCGCIDTCDIICCEKPMKPKKRA